MTESDHSDTIRSVSGGDVFHFFDPSQDKWIESEVEELEEFRSSYSADRVHFSDEMVDGSRLRGSMSKSSFKDQVRDSEKKLHTGSREDCEVCGDSR